jgi:DNA-binding NarL/FixJ family response regulator
MNDPAHRAFNLLNAHHGPLRRVRKPLAGSFLRYRNFRRHWNDAMGADMGVTEMDPRALKSGQAHLGSNDGHHRHGIGAGTSLLIVDHAPTRVGVRMALGDEVDICAEAADAETAIRAAKREQPDIALVGTTVLTDWCAVITGICRAAPGCAVVVLADAEDADDLLGAVRAGAVGYVPGPVDVDRLRRVFAAVMAHEAVVPRSMVNDLLGELRAGATASDTLTAREAQVLGMLRRGHSTGRIAERLQIAPVTVRRHISEVVRKLGVASRADLIDDVA